MQAFAALSMLTIGTVTLVVGIRLLLVWRRTRQLPELAFGIAFITGSVGSALAQVGQRVLWNDAGSVATVMNAFCFGLQVVGTAALLFVTWRVFRPNAAWARIVCVAGTIVTAGCFGARVMSGELATATIETPAMLVFFAIRFSIFVWSGGEALHYHGMLKRRMALGMGEPVVAQQIWFWGVAGVTTAMMQAVITGTTFVLHLHPVEYAPSTIAITITAIATSAAMWCAFFPPKALRRRVEAANA